MFGFSRLFRSRWRALAWSAGILWLAVEMSSSGPAATDPDMMQVLTDLQARAGTRP